MFTGIIEEVGTVTRRAGDTLVIRAKTVLEDVRDGDSIAVDGVCLTVAEHGEGRFTARVSPETYQRTTLGRLREGSAVNLERALALGDRLGGHLVQGHVDGVGKIRSIQPQGEFSLWRFQAPAEVARYLVPKGSVAVDGISLTVVDPAGDSFAVALIPATLEKTTLGSKGPGDPVNMEADVFGKHIYHYLKGLSSAGELTLDTLARHGFA